MNIMFMLAESSISGANKSMCVLAEYLQMKGNNCIVILPKNGKIEFELKQRNIKYYIVNSYTWVICKNDRQISTLFKCFIKKILNNVSIYKICKIIKNEKIDIVHNNSSSTYVGAVAAKICNKKLVWHFREFLEEDHGIEISRIFNSKKIINKSDLMICISNCIYEKFSSIYNSNNMCMIYNGININDFEIIKSFNPQKKIVVTIVGRVYPGKGQFDVVKAVELLQKNYDLTTNIVGINDDDYSKKIEKYVYEHNIKNISLIPVTNDVKKYYSISDIVVVASKNEAFGRVTIEGMMSSNLVIGSDTAGTKELIKDGENGLLYKCGDYVDLSRKILYAIQNPILVNKIIENARKYSKENFSSNINAEKIFCKYKEILKR